MCVFVCVCVCGGGGGGLCVVVWCGCVCVCKRSRIRYSLIWTAMRRLKRMYRKRLKNGIKGCVLSFWLFFLKHTNIQYLFMSDSLGVFWIASSHSSLWCYIYVLSPYLPPYLSCFVCVQLAGEENGGSPELFGRTQRPDPPVYTPGVISRLIIFVSFC